MYSPTSGDHKKGRCVVFATPEGQSTVSKGQGMTGIEYKFNDSGEWVFLKIPGSLLCFSRDEWARAIKRGKSVIRNRKARQREARSLDRKQAATFPHFE
jgi:hypothetical protein